jgi:hypothetical protein
MERVAGSPAGGGLEEAGTGGRRTRAPVSRAHRRQLARSAAVALPAIAVIVFLAWPMLFTSAGMGEDWVSHLWFIWRQSLTIARDHQPSLFLNYNRSLVVGGGGGSVFYPLYAFYGGTIYTLAGALTLVLGNSPVAAYVLTYMIGFAAAYGGWFWLGRMAGLGRWAAQVPGLLFISSGYYLTLIYARGDWPEFIGVSSIPLLAASALSVLRAKRLQILPAVALAGSTLVFFGSHSITMLWGLTMLTLLGVAIVVAVPRARSSITRAGVIRVAAVAVPAALVNAWYLLPAVAYVSRTSVANVYNYAGELHAFAFLLSAGSLFTPWHTAEILNTPDFVYALPVFTVAWVLVGIAISLRHRGDSAWRRVLWIVSGVSVLFAVLMTHPDLILDLPHPYTLVQFGFRLEDYVLLGLSAAVLVILVLARSRPGRWRLGSWTVVIVLVAAGAGAVQQVDGYPSGTSRPPYDVVADRHVVFAPNGEAPLTAGLGCEPRIGCGYDDNTLPLIESEGLPEVNFPISAIHGDRVTLAVDQPVGALVGTNLAGAPYFVDVTGAQVIGRDPNGHIVLRVTAAKDHSGARISLSPSNRLPLVLGRAITLLALAFLAVASVAVLARHLRMRFTRLGS